MKVFGQSSGTRIVLSWEDIIPFCQMLNSTDRDGDGEATITISADGDVKINGHLPASWKRVRDALIRDGGIRSDQADSLTHAALEALRAGD